MDMKKINDEYLKFYGTPEVKDASGKVIKAKVDGVKDKIEANIKKFEDSIEKLGNEKSYYKVLKSDPAKAKKWIVNTFLYNFYKDTFLYSIGVK